MRAWICFRERPGATLKGLHSAEVGLIRKLLPRGPLVCETQVILEWLELREIRVQVHRKGCRSTHLRLWTTLLDPATAPARELVELYAQGWEHELFYQEIKRQLHKSGLLQSWPSHFQIG